MARSKRGGGAGAGGRTRAKAGGDPGAVFPIMAWNSCPGDPAVLGRMRECGLTLAGFAAAEHLDAVHAAGMRAIVSDPRLSQHDWRRPDKDAIRRDVAAAVEATREHPAVFGYYLKDEPSAEEFAGLAVAAGEVRRLAPGKWPYINLFPNYATPAQLGSPTYAEHLRAFVRTCRPPILSYDNYSLMEREDVRGAYWTNLEEIRAASVRSRIPFWNIVLSVAHFNYRELTAADARFQAFTTLAYGGRGLSYFTYFAPSIGNYRMAPVDQFGNATATWHHLRHVNLQIARLAPTLLRLRPDRAYHLGHVPAGCQGPDERSLVTSAGAADLLVGDFTHEDGSRYAMVVNKSFHDSAWCSPTYRKPPAKVWIVSPYSGAHEPYAGEQCVLAPGQGTLLKLEA
jgi:hypothetical protein